MYAKSTVTIANILEAAESCFVAKNYNDVTMAEIAAQAEVTKGALYHHFASKEELYLTMMHRYLEEIEALVVETAVHLQAPVRDRLWQLTMAFLSLSDRKQALMRLVRRDINKFQDPVRQELVRSYQKALPEKAERIIREGICEDKIEAQDARLLAWEYVAIVEVVLSAYARQVLGEAGTTADFVNKLFFDGISVK
jgi:AcrR family transcriptional regulator